MPYQGPPITLSTVTFWAPGRVYADKPASIDGVAYLGVIERKSDGLTVLSVRKPGNEKALNIETGRVISITAHGREWRPEAAPERWMLRAAEIKAFVERRDLEEWAKPYFDPRHEKYHRNRRTSDDSAAEQAPPMAIKVGLFDNDAEPRRPLYDPRDYKAARDDDARHVGWVQRLINRLFRRP